MSFTCGGGWYQAIGHSAWALPAAARIVPAASTAIFEMFTLKFLPGTTSGPGTRQKHLTGFSAHGRAQLVGSRTENFRFLLIASSVKRGVGPVKAIEPNSLRPSR